MYSEVSCGRTRDDEWSYYFSYGSKYPTIQAQGIACVRTGIRPGKSRRTVIYSTIYVHPNALCIKRSACFSLRANGALTPDKDKSIIKAPFDWFLGNDMTLLSGPVSPIQTISLHHTNVIVHSRNLLLRVSMFPTSIAGSRLSHFISHFEPLAYDRDALHRDHHRVRRSTGQDALLKLDFTAHDRYACVSAIINASSFQWAVGWIGYRPVGPCMALSR